MEAHRVMDSFVAKNGVFLHLTSYALEENLELNFDNFKQ